jgi:hypothetical protein
MMCEKHFGSTLQLKDNYPLPQKRTASVAAGMPIQQDREIKI